MTIPIAPAQPPFIPSKDREELRKYLLDLSVFGNSYATITSDRFTHIPIKDIHKETLSLPTLYEQSPLIVNAYTDEMDVLSYYDVKKWISENKELAQAMIDGGGS